AVEHYGYPREQFLAMTPYDLRVPEEAGKLREIFERGAPMMRRAPGRHRRRDGSVIDVEVTATRLTFASRPAYVALAVDVTDWMQAQRALAESEHRYRDLFENATVPIATVDLKDTITDVNGAF